MRYLPVSPPNFPNFSSYVGKRAGSLIPGRFVPTFSA
jgi:hypothetical protein